MGMIMCTYIINGVQSIQPLLSLLLVVWTYISDAEMIWAWTMCIYNWTLGPIIGLILFVWGTITNVVGCGVSCVTCTCCPQWCWCWCCCKADPDYTEVPGHEEHDKL